MSELQPTEPEPQPPVLYQFPLSDRHDTYHPDMHEQLATAETVGAIVAAVKDLTRSERGAKDTFLFKRSNTLFDRDGNCVELCEYGIFEPHYVPATSPAREFYNEELSMRVAGITLSSDPVTGTEAMYSVTRGADDEYVLSSHEFYATDSGTNAPVYKEVIAQLNEINAQTLLGVLESLQN